MTRPFVMYPHKALRTPAIPVTEITDDIRAIWDEMINAMDTMPGVGLAAPQLGLALPSPWLMPAPSAEKPYAWPTPRFCTVR